MSNTTDRIKRKRAKIEAQQPTAGVKTMKWNDTPKVDEDVFTFLKKQFLTLHCH